jgi:hypothetical protein
VDELEIAAVAAGNVAQAGRFIGAGGGKDLGLQEVEIAPEGRAVSTVLRRTSETPAIARPTTATPTEIRTRLREIFRDIFNDRVAPGKLRPSATLGRRGRASRKLPRFAIGAATLQQNIPRFV